MHRKLKSIKGLSFLLIIPVLMLISTMSSAQTDENNNHQVFIDEMLRMGNIRIKTPAYDTIENLKGNTYSKEDLLESDYLRINKLKPQQNTSITINGIDFEWEKAKTNKDNFLLAEHRQKKGIDQLGYFATYIEVDRWMEAEIKISCPQLFQAFLNGNLLTSKTSIDEEYAEEIGSNQKKCKLENGKHLLIIKTVKPTESKTDWKIKTVINFDKKYPLESLKSTSLPKQKLDIDHLLNGQFVNSVSISPDGDWAIFSYTKKYPPDGSSENWTEIRDLNSNTLIQSFRNADVSGLRWTPKGRKLTYRTTDKDKGTTLWLFDLDNMTEKVLIKDIEDFNNLSWAEDESFIIYGISKKPDKNKSGLNKFEGMPDRWPWWRNRNFLYKIDIQSGFTERLTYGHLSTNLQDIRPDGKKILFSIDIPDFNERPYSKQYLIEMDLETYALDTIWIKRFSGNCSYSPNGESLLVTGSPAMFGDLGINIKGDAIPNDYDTQAFTYNLSSGDVDPITLSFNPSVQQVFWSKFDENRIYFLATDSTYVRIYRYDLNTRYFEKINSGFDVVSGLSIATNSPTAVCTGSGISTPQHANKINLESGEIDEIANPRKAQYENIVFGKTEDWKFKNYSGLEIDGTIYYPPKFDKDKKYPLIVYYYGGTSPVSRSFGGRYPKNLFAAQGYVVYVLQPSGAVGFGQTFSSRHVNNWGITVADEIIMGTQLFVESHPFIDEEKVGCIGASYGGFMTMLLQTRTDIFSAAISHAGISSISSYWGEGYWGYLYSSVASANSFPWNNSEIYIGQSPLFNADKINTPLLLLHGSDDTNVPPGESIQLYTALKLLGKPVELIEVKGQNHQILDYKKRIMWQKTIFAWFDKWLKDQPGWWDDLYPDKNL